MFQGLKIAVKRQKKLLGIFLITIFMPSVLLGISGIETKMAEVNQKLENLANYPSLQVNQVQLPMYMRKS